MPERFCSRCYAVSLNLADEAPELFNEAPASRSLKSVPTTSGDPDRPECHLEDNVVI